MNANTTMQYHIQPEDIWHIKSKYNIGKLPDFPDEFCENCKIQSVLLYTAASGQPMLHIKYIIEPDTSIYNLNIDSQKHDISYIFKRKWDTDIYKTHCELFRKFELPKIQDLHEDLMASYWHIDNMPIWFHELSKEWKH